MKTEVYNEPDKLCSSCFVLYYMHINVIIKNNSFFLVLSFPPILLGCCVQTCICAWNLSMNGFTNGGPGQAIEDIKEEGGGGGG